MPRWTWYDEIKERCFNKEEIQQIEANKFTIIVTSGTFLLEY